MLSRILRQLSAVGRLLGRTANEWAEWAAEHPEAAALGLDQAAGELEARSYARRRPQGWWSRRLRARAAAFRRQAEALRDDANRQRACKVAPGQWKG